MLFFAHGQAVDLLVVNHAALRLQLLLVDFQQGELLLGEHLLSVFLHHFEMFGALLDPFDVHILSEVLGNLLGALLRGFGRQSSQVLGDIHLLEL